MVFEGEQFAGRHIGPTSSDEAQMLQVLGYADIKSFISDVIPKNIAIEEKLSEVLDGAKSEVAVIAELREIAAQNSFHLTYRRRVLRNTYASGYQEKRFRKSSLVHCLHAISARDFTRAPRGALRISNSNLRNDGASAI